MPDWVLIPCLARLRTEFDLMAPNRDRASDGSKGDDAHEDRVSDHNPDETGKVPIRDADRTNEVHAIDVDDDLRVPGLSMEATIQFLLRRCRAGLERRLRYIIYNRRIWEASNDWRQRAYSGDNPHTEHAHFSASYDTTREADTSPWHLGDLTMATPEETRAIVREELTAFGKRDPIASIFVRTGYLANQFAGAISKAVAEIAAEDVDEQELATRLAALLPNDEDVTPEALQAAIIGAFRELTAPST